MGNQVPSWEGLATNPWKREEILVTVKAYPHPYNAPRKLSQ